MDSMSPIFEAAPKYLIPLGSRALDIPYLPILNFLMKDEISICHVPSQSLKLVG